MQLLDGQWELARDPTNLGRAERWFECCHTEAREAPVPGIIQQVFPDYHSVAWYWHRFRTAETLAANQRCLLHFGAVDYLADVWLNGVLVGSHEGGETPFTLDVTDALKPDGENLLAVRVLNPSDEPTDGIRLQETPHRNKFVADYQPGRSYNAGGIVLLVALQIVPAVRIADLFARADSVTGQIQLVVTVRNDTAAPAMGRLAAWAGPANTADAQATAATDTAVFAAGETSHTLQLSIAQPPMNGNTKEPIRTIWQYPRPYLAALEGELS